MDREFIAERQRGLQTYLDSITQHPLLSSSLYVKKFLDPNNYSANYTGESARLHWEIIVYQSEGRTGRQLAKSEFPLHSFLCPFFKRTDSF